jgi:hypothetical protein
MRRTRIYLKITLDKLCVDWYYLFMATMTYSNVEFGIEAIVMPHADAFKVVLRDTEATVSVIFGSLEVVTKKALEFVK